MCSAFAFWQPKLQFSRIFKLKCTPIIYHFVTEFRTEFTQIWIRNHPRTYLQCPNEAGCNFSISFFQSPQKNILLRHSKNVSKFSKIDKKKKKLRPGTENIVMRNASEFQLIWCKTR